MRAAEPSTVSNLTVRDLIDLADSVRPQRKIVVCHPEMEERVLAAVAEWPHVSVKANPHIGPSEAYVMLEVHDAAGR